MDPAVDLGDIHRSEDGGKTWQKCEVTWSVTIADQIRQDFIFSETDGFHELADGTVICKRVHSNSRPGSPRPTCFVRETAARPGGWFLYR